MSSSTVRRGDRGLGKTASGGNKGSFASHEREAAAAPPSQIERPFDFEQRAKQLDEARRRVARIRWAAYRHELELVEQELAIEVKSVHPDAAQLVLGRNYDADSYQWCFSGVRRADGSDIELGPEFENRIDNAVFGHGLDAEQTPYEVEDGSDAAGEWDETTVIDLDRALSRDLNMGRRFVDSDDLSEDDFTAVYHAAAEQLNLSGVVYTRGDIADEIGEDWELADGGTLSEEQTAQLAEAASKSMWATGVDDDTFEMLREWRRGKIADTAKGLGLSIQERDPWA